MKVIQRSPLYVLQIAILVVCIFAAVWLDLSCKKDDPVSSRRCGSGDVFWDKAAGKCKDRATGAVVDNACCGQ
ncbi:MAG: hypothetical protein AABZ61_04325 [Bacteroidota bacterium]